MSQQNKREEPIAIFHYQGNGSNNGSILANKNFHIVYHILKHDFTNKLKTIIGILYNKADGPNNKLYFSCSMPLKEQFSIPYLLENIIYKPRYDKYLIKKALTEDPNTKSILIYAEKILVSKLK